MMPIMKVIGCIFSAADNSCKRKLEIPLFVLIGDNPPKVGLTTLFVLPVISVNGIRLLS